MYNADLRSNYQSWFIADAYDVLAGVVFAPVGGLAPLRRSALEHSEIARGERVLELGCGSGGVTRLLCERGARVTSVDWSGPMLRRAARRASAEFVCAELTAFEPQAGGFDVVLFSFVLHELGEPERAQALALARRALGPHGRLIVVDHALPSHGFWARAMSRFVHAFEPQSVRGAWLRPGGPERELAAAGFSPGRRSALASGMAFFLDARVAMRESSGLS